MDRTRHVCCTPATRLLVGLVIAFTCGDVAADVSVSTRTFIADPDQLAVWLRNRDPIAESGRAHVMEAAELAAQTRVYPNPQLSFGLGNIVLGRGNLFDPLAPGPTALSKTANASVGLSQLFEIGKREPRQAAGDLRARSASETAVASLGERVNGSTVTLGKLAYVQARRALIAENLEAARKLQENERIRLDRKDLPGLDFYRIELDTQALEVELDRADADLRIALAECSAALFATCSTEGLDGSALDAGAPLPAMLPDPEAAIGSRPERQAKQLEALAFGQDAVLADHRKIPDVTLGAGFLYDAYAFSGSAPRTFGFSIELPLPFFDRGNHDAAAARSAARAVNAEEAAIRHTEVRAAEALEAQRGSLLNVRRRLETEAVPRAAKIVEQARKAFDIGQSGVAELLLAERQYRDLQRAVLDTRYELFSVRALLRDKLGLDDAAARRAELGR